MLEKRRKAHLMNHILQHRYSVKGRKQKGSNAEKDLRSIHRKKDQNWDCDVQ